MASLSVFFSTGVVCLHLFALFCLLPLAITDKTETDRRALLCFRSQISAPTEALSSWSNASLDPCNWHGVTCSTRPPRHVIAIDLASEGIAGPISPCIANITSLARLELSNNSFHGMIPSELGLLRQLTNLSLSMNSLEGNIPSELSSCAQLQSLTLQGNSLHGEIPSSLSQCIHLQKINLGSNKLQGSIPSAFGDLPELQKLLLANNRLSGNIPPSLGSRVSLTSVDLGRNALTGGIPKALMNSSSLEKLWLDSNSLSGELPQALLSISSLTVIYLQYNNFVGSMPPVTAISPQVKSLDLGYNNLTGTIPSSLGNLSSLIYLRLTQNDLHGSIPESLCHIPTLQKLALNSNSFSGAVPPCLFNMSSLTFLGVSNNSLTGRIPPDIGYTLPNIESLGLSANKFEGSIPTSLLNATQLQYLNLADNKLTGIMPLFGSLTKLDTLDVAYNMLEAGDWGFVSSLSNCFRLTELLLDGNNFQGNLPNSFGNLSRSLESLWIRDNKISGHIPSEIGNLKSLTKLYMDYNQFSGSIPPSIGNLSKLGVLSFAQNKLSGQIPDNTGNLVQLNSLKLDRNNLSGSIPESIGNCSKLLILNLAHNSLDGGIPEKILRISSLSQELDLSHNHLSGSIPEEVGNLFNLNILRISNNRLSGNIPPSLGHCFALEYLSMQRNSLVGNIPQSFMNLVGIKEMDISQNNLSGNIPQFLASLGSLHNLNLSFNSLEGAIPSGGIFGNIGVVSIEGNDRLCMNTPTDGLPLCSSLIDKKRKHKSLVLALKIVIPSVLVVFSLLCLTKILLRKKIEAKTPVNPVIEHMQITYEDVVKATNRFSFANLIGSGSFGMVYKGNLQIHGDQVAIKIFNLGIYGAHKSFVAECETLRNVRHRNLLKIITLCSSVDSNGADFKALVFPYLPNGNLDMWLHPKTHEHTEKKVLTLSQRINIVLDVAFALDYLHNQSTLPVIHCDLKPSNILLDLDMVAYVTDFGLARFVYTRSNAHQDTSTSLACLKGSIGYIPPEYGMSEDISTKGDVYSFGILLLEMVTGRSPTDEKFNGGTTLHEFAGRALPNNIHDVVDPTILQNGISVTNVMESCIIPLVKIGLSCSMTLPGERPEMGQVCTMILRIKHAVSNMHVR
ncbi:receptor kinase-like protein Xa21 [Oryza brachyantha]|uniref:receptor kinase-like protein Xa21 n=1 Tax=Oryza brachyantha TaxID=4533 RepID=UPI000776A106|nr:receptor kinase-like protein Xa21 [Oryza brachyantha]